MTAFQCPKCEIRFVSRNELEHHCRRDHPQFQHEFHAASEHPAVMPPVASAPEPHDR